MSFENGFAFTPAQFEVVLGVLTLTAAAGWPPDGGCRG
jgi:hypothetical protein